VAGSAELDPRLFLRLAGQLPYLAGLLLDMLGFAASVLALRTLPLFLVQAAVAAGVAVTALGAAWLLRVRLRPVEVGALVAAGTGLLLLALSARPAPAAGVPPVFRWLVLAGAVLVLVLGVVAARVPGPYGVAALAAGAGLAFGGVGVAARILELPRPLWRVLTEPEVYALVGYGALGLLLFATALQRGSVTTVSAIMFAVETVVPAAIGLAWLGDSARPGYAWVAAAGFALTLVGALELARHGEVAAPAP
jgi:drug/metabolite transporter (DMT)-like permease